MHIENQNWDAQATWELCRPDAYGHLVVRTTSNAGVIDTLAGRADELSWGGKVTIIAALLRNICPQWLLRDAVAGRWGEVAQIDAACHPDADTDAAADVIRWNINATRHDRTAPLMPLPADRLGAAIDGSVPGPGSGREIADEVALANHGFISARTSASVRRWLEQRDATAIDELRPVAAWLGGRADLSDEELEACVAILALDASRGISSPMLTFLRRHRTDDQQAAGIVERHLAKINNSVIYADALNSLLIGRNAEGQANLLASSARSYALDSDVRSTIVRAVPGLTDAFKLLSNSERNSSQVGRCAAWLTEAHRRLEQDTPVNVLLSATATAPDCLTGLNGEQLSLFAQLAPTFTGTAAQLAELTVRAA